MVVFGYLFGDVFFIFFLCGWVLKVEREKGRENYVEIVLFYVLILVSMWYYFCYILLVEVIINIY